MSKGLPRRYLRAALAAQPRPKVTGMRSPVECDCSQLARLMCAAYRGTVDDEGENEEVALVEVRKTFAGEYGAFVPHCSKVVAPGQELLHATLVTKWEGRPFIAFSMTEPNAKRSGLARACLVNAMQDLRIQGESELRLVVTLANLPALSLYQSLGFVVQE
jgi:ribosomal protein S18 acetylase RimI-like enzyme